MPLLAALLGLTGPIVTRVLATLGVGIFTITGLNACLTLVFNSCQSSFNGLPADIAGLLFLSGLPQALAIILSAAAARISMVSLSKIQRLI